MAALSHRRVTCGLVVITTAATVGLAGCNSPGLSGAGASFPAAIYQRWFPELANQGTKVNYQSVGSGAGVRQFIAGTVDFAASDVPMKSEEISKVSRGVLQLPMTAGAIAVAYNHKGCQLKLSQAQLANIFLGKISNFGQLGCIAKPIKVVFRSDGSGTTANFTAHLSAISPAWKSGPGQGKSVTWPTGVGAKGNEGMAAQLSQMDGSIGYVESAYVKGVLQAASLSNAAGAMIKPSTESAAKALASIDLGSDLTGRNPNPQAGYPIATFSWILLYREGNGAKLPVLQKIFSYTLSDSAQAIATTLGFVSLPAPVLAQSRRALQRLKN
ncbi:MAG: phosphate ABC transporter substrate-binding protein PstS [Cyanobacteria bacterium]|nr:phosphate ABC transporter substrate-binding protein PstS [Cyanobacteriota bacterium]